MAPGTTASGGTAATTEPAENAGRSSTDTKTVSHTNTKAPEVPPKLSRNASMFFQIPTGRIENRDPKTLNGEHPLLRVLFPGTLSDEANEDLADSMSVRQYQAVLVTGDGCVSPPGTALDGRRRKLGALQRGQLLTIEVLDNLTADQEEGVVIHANIAAGLARRLDERQKAVLEHRPDREVRDPAGRAHGPHLP